MTISKYEESLHQLSSGDENKRLAALRFIKNSVIGNKTKKDLYIQLGIVQRLAEYMRLDDATGYNLKVQAATILGSIAYGKDENVNAIVSCGVINPLLDALAQRPGMSEIDSIRERRKLLEAVTRALKSIFNCPRSPKDDVFTPRHLADLVSLLTTTSAFLTQEGQTNATSEGVSFGMIAEFSAAIVAKCCETQEQQMQMATAGVVQPLVNLLHSGHIKVQEAALDALATLCRENNFLGEIIINAKSMVSNQLTTATMLDFVRDKYPNMRLMAATCLTNLYRTGVFSEPFSEIVLVVLPALVQLLKEPTGDIQERAPLVLADLVKDSEDMQKAAYDADAIPSLAELLASVSKDTEEDAENRIGIPGVGSVAKRKEKIKENSLIAIAAATLLKEDCRTLAIESKILPHVVAALQSKHPHVRLAACQCAKSLSRSVSNLRTSLVDAGVAPPLLKLLQDESIVVQAAACGALCNLTLSFSPMKKSVIESGAIDRFVEYTQSSDAKLQLNGVWALNNLLFNADLDAKRTVMKALSYDALIELLHEPNPAIQEQALGIVRNLLCGQQEDVEDVIEGIGKDDLLDVLESKLQVTSDMEVDHQDNTKTNVNPNSVLLPSLYAIVNMSSTSDHPRNISMSRPNIVNSVIHHLSNSDPQVRVAACWCIINWTWCNTDDNREALLERIERLLSLGIESKLKAMEKDPSREVRDRVRTALDQLKVEMEEDTGY